MMEAGVGQRIYAGFIANSKYKIQGLSRTQIAFFKHQNYGQKAIS